MSGSSAGVMEEPKFLLSILSNVSHGYVGNRSVAFPLQFYGWDVDTINTTDFLNHPGYGNFKGQKTDPEQIKRLFHGLGDIMDTKNSYKVVLVGYCPAENILQTVYDLLEPIVSSSGTRPALVVDPVLGDNGKLYVPPEVVPVHQNFLKLGYVSLITPNQFELEILTDTKVKDRESLLGALRKLHKEYHIPNIVVSSAVVEDQMVCVGYKGATADHKEECFCLPISEIKCKFNGCGDVFAAILIHAFYENKLNISPKVLNFAMSKMSKILQLSYDMQLQQTGKPPQNVLDVRIIGLRHVLLDHEDADPKVDYIV